jgi:hypothetical protein
MLTRRDHWSGESAVLTAGLGLIFGAALSIISIVSEIGGTDPTPPGLSLVTTSDHPRSPVARLLDRSDGQTFAAIAQDPSLSRPEVFRAGRPEAAYRAQRPLLGYLGWTLSLGRPVAVGWVFVSLNVLAAGLAAWAAALELQRRWAPPVLGAFIVLVPGTLFALRYLTSEVVALSLVLWALHWWRARPWMAGSLLVLAALTRETTLCVVIGMAIYTLTRDRDRQRLWALTAPFVAYGAWMLVVHARYGAWPWEAETVQRTRPLLDLLDLPLASALTLVIAVAFGLAAVVARPSDLLSHVIVAHVLVIAALGSQTLAQWSSVDRLLVPLWATAIIACFAAWFGRSPDLSSGVERANPESG